MSAFQVSDKHISQLVIGAMLLGCVKPGDMESIGGMLAEENALSVSYRYRGDAEPASFTFEPCDAPELPALVKLINCLNYQSCEHPEWETSEACKWLEMVKETATARWKRSKAEWEKAYDDAPWGV